MIEMVYSGTRRSGAGHTFRLGDLLVAFFGRIQARQSHGDKALQLAPAHNAALKHGGAEQYRVQQIL